MAAVEREQLVSGEQAARIGAALEAAAKAERLLLTDAAASVLRERIASALQRGEALEAATAVAVAQYHRQLVRRQVQQSTWDPSSNTSRKVSGVLKFMPFKHKDAEYLEYDLLSLVFRHLPFGSLGPCALVSKRWRSVATDPSWKPELVCLAWGRAGLTGLPGARACPRPTPLPFAMERPVIQVCCADASTLALTADGLVWHWGNAWLASLGRADEPTQLPELRDVGAIACTVPGYYHGRRMAAGFHCAAVTRRGALYTWGLNDRRQLLVDHGVTDEFGALAVARPTRVSFAGFNAAAADAPSDPLDGRPIERVEHVACGRYLTAVHAAGHVLTQGAFCRERPHALRTWGELEGLEVRQLAAGAFPAASSPRAARSGRGATRGARTTPTATSWPTGRRSR